MKFTWLSLFVLSLAIAAGVQAAEQEVASTSAKQAMDPDDPQFAGHFRGRVMDGAAAGRGPRPGRHPH